MCFFYNSKLQTQFKSMEVRNALFSAFIDLLTPNTYVMVIISDPDVCKFAMMFICEYMDSTFHIYSNVKDVVTCITKSSS